VTDPAGARLRTAAVTLAARVSLAPGAFAQGAAAPATGGSRGACRGSTPRATSAWLSTMARACPADVWARLSAVRMVDTGEVGKALAHLVATDPQAAEAAFAGLAQTPALDDRGDP
jgi:hypothetical protein